MTDFSRDIEEVPYYDLTDDQDFELHKSIEVFIDNHKRMPRLHEYKHMIDLVRYPDIPQENEQ